MSSRSPDEAVVNENVADLASVFSNFPETYFDYMTAVADSDILLLIDDYLCWFRFHPDVLIGYFDFNQIF